MGFEIIDKEGQSKGDTKVGMAQIETGFKTRQEAAVSLMSRTRGCQGPLIWYLFPLKLG